MSAIRTQRSAPAACSTIFIWTAGVASFQLTFTVCSGQTTMQSAQPMHAPGEMNAFASAIAIAPEGQWDTHVPHPVQPAGSTAGATVECCASFPAREAHPIFFHHVLKALRRGARLYVIDPRRTLTAREGLHLQLRPGTDCALALGMMHVIFRDSLDDRDYLEKYTIGADQLRGQLAAVGAEQLLSHGARSWPGRRSATAPRRRR